MVLSCVLGVEREVTLNEEHDDYEWLSPADASARLGENAARLARAVEHAAIIAETGRFEAVEDPYAEESFTSEEVLAELAEIRGRDGPPE